MKPDLSDVLASIDGALADSEFPDAMRWSPDPGSVTDASDLPYDGEVVPLPAQQYEREPYDVEHDYDPNEPIGPRNFPRVSTRRGGIRFGRPADLLIVDDPIPAPPRAPAHGDVEHRADCSIVHHYLDRSPACQCGALDRAALRRPPLEVHTRERAGELLLILAPDVETARQAFQQIEHMARAMGVAAQQAFEAVGAALTAFTADLRPILERAGVLPDEGPDPSEQPFERALWHKARQGTGPDRQVQHRPRPRRHLL